jgi:hypothetical protein
MVQNLNVNADINVPVPGLLFTVPFATLLHPVQAPAGYPTQLMFDLERIRQKIVLAL